MSFIAMHTFTPTLTFFVPTHANKNHHHPPNHEEERTSSVNPLIPFNSVLLPPPPPVDQAAQTFDDKPTLECPISST